MNNITTTLEDRLGGHNFNAWPDMDVVAVTVIDMNDPMAAHNFGYLEGASEVYRQVRDVNLPQEVQSRLRNWKTLYHLVQTRFVLATAHGQGDDVETRNIYALIGAKIDYDFKTRRRFFATPALIIELGCDHDYEVRHPFRCVSTGECRKCGHTWEVDSGD